MYLRSLFVLTILLLGGCSVPSLHGIATPEVLVDDEGLQGIWVEEGGQVLAKVDRSARGTYTVTMATMDQESGLPPRTSVFEARLVELGGRRLADLVLGQDQREALVRSYNALTVRTHQFLLVQREGNTLRLWMPDYDRFRNLLRSGRTGLPTAELADAEGGPDMVITATTLELQRFFSQREWDAELFREPIVLQRLRGP